MEISKCNCGRGGRYGHFSDGKEVISCNKYAVCLTHDEQHEKIKELSRSNAAYEGALEKIVRVNAMDYEYKSWAKQALEVINSPLTNKG